MIQILTVLYLGFNSLLIGAHLYTIAIQGNLWMCVK